MFGFRRRQQRRRDEPLGRDPRRSQQDFALTSLPGLRAGPEHHADSGVEYFYEPGTVLVREEFLVQAEAIMVREGRREPGQRDRREPPRDRPDSLRACIVEPGGRREGEPPGIAVVAGTRLLPFGLKQDDEHDTLGVARQLRRELGHGAVSLNHLVHITGDAGVCPADEPEPVAECTALWPAPAKDRFAGTGVKIVVVDTGLDHDTVVRHPFMAGVEGECDRQVTPGRRPQLLRYAGHGTFIAGLIRTVAPGAEVMVRHFLSFAGKQLESELAPMLSCSLDEDDPDIISMSAGTQTWDGSGLLSLAAFNERQLRHHKGVVLVAAAGNDSSRTPFWPAAAPFAISAGSLNRTLDDRADFTNFGGWVDCYTHGQDVVGIFPKGSYQYGEGRWEHANPPRVVDFTGLARWSGTSFSTPIVAALIAARMSHTGENGQTAAAALLRTAQAAARPGVGAILLP
ncbi:S8 family peptidase [Dactylosporangium sp. NPDC051541]|uniref:S8 family peptidase n=1 Tax=Dactylosporangium sp. NPDC051541 TaxID=3363977 RepID=UPI00378CAE59